MITTDRFTAMMNANLAHRTPTKVDITYYARESDGLFYIPSLGYGMPNGENERHFCCDDSGFCDPDSFVWPDNDVLYFNYDQQSKGYETYDDLPSALFDMMMQRQFGGNNHAVHAIAERNVEGKITHIALLIYYV